MGQPSFTRRAITSAVLVALAPYSLVAAAQTKLIVQSGSTAPTISQIPLFVAEDAGFLAKEGLAIELRFSPGAPQAAQVTASGGADVGLISLEPVVQGYERGIRGKAFYSIYARQHFFYAVMQDSPIKTLADLKGKKFGVVSSGSAAIVFAKSMLATIGAPVDDALFLPVGLGDAAMVALKSGQIDALALWDAVYGGLERSGVKLRFFYHPELSEFGSGAMFVSDKTLAERRPLLIGMARAYAKGVVFFLENPEAALRIYWKRNPAAKSGASDADMIANGLKEARFMLKTFSTEGRVDQRHGAYDMALAKRYVDTFREQGLIGRAIAPQDIITNSLVAEINAFDVNEVKALARGWK